jgi:hypothetical protein
MLALSRGRVVYHFLLLLSGVCVVCMHRPASVKPPIDDPFLRWNEIPSVPGNASRFGPARVLASSGLAPTPARMAQKIVNQTSDHEIRCFPVLHPPFSLIPSLLLLILLSSL